MLYAVCCMPYALRWPPSSSVTAERPRRRPGRGAEQGEPSSFGAEERRKKDEVRGNIRPGRGSLVPTSPPTAAGLGEHTHSDTR